MNNISATSHWFANERPLNQTRHSATTNKVGYVAQFIFAAAGVALGCAAGGVLGGVIGGVIGLILPSLSGRGTRMPYSRPTYYGPLPATLRRPANQYRPNPYPQSFYPNPSDNRRRSASRRPPPARQSQTSRGRPSATVSSNRGQRASARGTPARGSVGGSAPCNEQIGRGVAC